MDRHQSKPSAGGLLLTLFRLVPLPASDSYLTDGRIRIDSKDYAFQKCTRLIFSFGFPKLSTLAADKPLRECVLLKAAGDSLGR